MDRNKKIFGKLSKVIDKIANTQMKDRTKDKQFGSGDRARLITKALDMRSWKKYFNKIEALKEQLERVLQGDRNSTTRAGQMAQNMSEEIAKNQLKYINEIMRKYLILRDYEAGNEKWQDVDIARDATFAKAVLDISKKNNDWYFILPNFAAACRYMDGAGHDLTNILDEIDKISSEDVAQAEAALEDINTETDNLESSQKNRAKLREFTSRIGAPQQPPQNKGRKPSNFIK